MVIYVRVQERRPNFKSGSTKEIYLIFRGLKFEPDAEIGLKMPFRSLRLSAKVSSLVCKGQVFTVFYQRYYQ
jgi:hypothetical protein